jgi:hypothetical protein
MSLYLPPPSISALPTPPSAYVCQVERWCDPRFRNELANDLGEQIAKLAPSIVTSGSPVIRPGTGELMWTGYAPTVEVGPTHG